MGHLKAEFPPLYPQGFHDLSFDQLKSAVVDAFPQSKRRERLWKSLLWLRDELKRHGIACTLWVDGSFTTQKLEPDDVDVVVEFDYDAVLQMTPAQQTFLRRLSSLEFHDEPRKLHTLMFPTGPITHAKGAQFVTQRKIWEDTFGFSLVNRTPKGIVRLKVTP